MTLEQAIEMFKALESGREDIPIGFHLHKSIHQALEMDWRTNDSYPETFSGFLTALKDEGDAGL